MSYTCFHIPANGITICPVDCNPDGTLSLHTLQESIDCTCIQIIKLSDNLSLVIDDEGKIFNKPVNNTATVLFCKHLGCYDFIVGDALLVTTRYPEGYTGEPDVFGFPESGGKAYAMYDWLTGLHREVRQFMS